MQKLSVIIGATIGNVLEWYDFILYALFATTLQSQFFAENSFIAVFGVFAVGYVMRPFGGVLIGHIGDRYSRKTALILTILIMGIATALIGLLPTYASIGVSAALLLILLRMIQGIALGGEFPGSMVILTELASPKHRGFLGAVGLSVGLSGMLIASGLANVLSSTLTPEELMEWGWRLAFLLGLVLAFVGLYLRFKVFLESAVTKAEVIHIPLFELLRHQKGAVLKAFLSMASAGVYTGILTLYTVTYVTHYLHMDLHLAFRLELYMTLAVFLLFPLGALLADKSRNFKNWLIFGNLAVGLSTYPLFLWMQTGTSACFWAYILLAMVYSIGLGPIAAHLVLQFPAPLRYSGFAIAHGLTFSIIGGTSPLVLDWLTTSYGPVAPCLYGIVACLIAAATLSTTKNTDS
ncbi:MAG TPA: MFS transporter [Chlamydiales bacterium]|nr:MFS transporter [Chlamydiales bacterium]